MLLRLFVLILLSASSTVGWAKSLPNPWSELSSIQKGDYLSPILNLKRLEQDYLNSPLSNEFGQAMATVLSFVGAYNEAQEYFDAADLSHSDFGRGINLHDFESLDATEVIINEARSRHVIMLNEAHHIPPCDYASNPDDCQDQRERGQAENLYNRTLGKDPSAKVLVHAGYGHIDKKGGHPSFPWTPMAKYFKDLSKTDPLTIDQVTFRARGKRQCEDKGYRSLVSHFNRNSPFIVRSKSTGTLWSSAPESYDIQVILPPFPNKRRPDWLMTMMERKEVVVQTSFCTKFPCLIQVIKQIEFAAAFVPFDQLHLSTKELQARLFLKPGDYVIKYVSENEAKEVNLRVAP